MATTLDLTGVTQVTITNTITNTRTSADFEIINSQVRLNGEGAAIFNLFKTNQAYALAAGDSVVLTVTTSEQALYYIGLNRAGLTVVPA